MTQLRIERFLAVTLLKLLDPAGGINQFLLSGIKWMAIAADSDVNFVHCRAGFKVIAAAACDKALVILWMNSFLHGKTL